MASLMTFFLEQRRLHVRVCVCCDADSALDQHLPAFRRPAAQSMLQTQVSPLRVVVILPFAGIPSKEATRPPPQSKE